ncbi:MAG: hypothetical protein K8R19_11890 [Methanosarcinales archaeon]|nr:hypothetical protein [Methanosarcinales archaeon]
MEGRRESEELTRAGISSILATESIEDTEKSNKALCTLWLKNYTNYIFQQLFPPPAAPPTTRGRRLHAEQPGAGCGVEREGRPDEQRQRRRVEMSEAGEWRNE